MEYFRNENIQVHLHYDKNQPKKNFEAIKKGLSRFPNVKVLENRVRCYWGEYSLVDATLRMMTSAFDLGFNPDYLYLFSDSCVPIKSFNNLQEFLYENNGKEFIEAYDIRYDKWVQDGLDVDRYKYYFPFNYRNHTKWFDRITAFQVKWNILRKCPDQLDIHFGSQWFCLTASTCLKVLKEMDKKELKTFFKWSWIPDEFAIQTLVHYCSGKESIFNESLTYVQFNSFGKPLVFYNDHLDHLLEQNRFFARKASSNATKLYQKLNEYTSTKSEPVILESLKVKDRRYQRYKNREMEAGQGGKIGRIKNPFNSGMESNFKPFTVLTCVSKEYLKEVTKQARASLGDQYVIYDYPFDHEKLDPISNGQSYMGISSEDFHRRNYDPVSFLYQLIHSSSKNVVFCIDGSDLGKIKEVSRWSREASVIIIDPYPQDLFIAKAASISPSRAAELLKLPEEECVKQFRKMEDVEKTDFWIKAMQEGAHANINYLKDHSNNIALSLSELVKRIDFLPFVPKENQRLIAKFGYPSKTENSKLN